MRIHIGRPIRERGVSSEFRANDSLAGGLSDMKDKEFKMKGLAILNILKHDTQSVVGNQ